MLYYCRKTGLIKYLTLLSQLFIFNCDCFMSLFADNCGRTKLTKEEELSLKSYYRDYVDSLAEDGRSDILSYEEFKQLLLSGGWTNEIPFLQVMNIE